MLNFLVNNIYVVFGVQVFQQSFVIPMDTNYAPLLTDLFLYSYEAGFMVVYLNHTYKYINDVLSTNNDDLLQLCTRDISWWT
jgi:hypothetical protein